MDFRRIVGLVLLVAVTAMVLPVAGEAGLGEEPKVGSRAADPGVFARILEWLQVTWVQVTYCFVPAEGATITPAG